MKLEIAVLLALISVPAAATIIVGQASVIDGDTIGIQGMRVRLFGIDAPESAQTCLDAVDKVYRCGQQAANALAAFIGSQTVSCEQRDVDRYGRTVAVCRAGDVDMADWLVRAGLALDWPRYSKGAYAAAQTAADGKQAGMWRGPFVEPWLYRACIRTGGRPDACSIGTR
jgi:endonuclease YncB( thermonuclease family)